MKHLFFMSLLALTIAAAGCSKDGEEDYQMPTESGTKIDQENGKVVRTQLVNSGKEAIVITYSFDIQNITYQGQEWEIIFGTKAGALAAYAGYQGYYALTEPSVKVTNSANVVKVTYPLGTGLGDDQLQTVNNLEAVESIVQVADILNIFNKYRTQNKFNYLKLQITDYQYYKHH